MINENGDIEISIPEENNEIMKFMKDSHLKRIINSDHQRTLAGPFSAMVPSKEPCFYESVQHGKAMF